MMETASHDLRQDTAHCVICPQCDWVAHLEPPAPHELACCPRCRHVIASGPTRPPQHAIAWALGALILLLLVFAFEFLGFDARGINHTMSYFDALRTFYDYGFPILALLVALTTVVLPALFLAAAIYTSLAALTQPPLPLAITAARLAYGIRHWMMSDVMLVGILISLIKIITLADIAPGPSFAVFCAFCVLLLKTMNMLDWTQLWLAIAGPGAGLPRLRPGATGRSQHAAPCRTCGTAFHTRGTHRCPRCGRRHWLQRMARLQLTWALLLTSLLLYIPANVFPIMHTQALFGSEAQTIAGGVLQLIAMGSWPIALIIFSASIVVPLTKIAALAWLCLCSHYGWHRNSVVQARLFRITERIGRWSMIDVFVVAILAALVQAGVFMSIKPGPAVLAFAAVVIMTMVAAETFDTRLLWPEQEKTQS
ncbi:MAG TPA: paraquat-inducible protein A [Salinisphaeraceae bacterium]|nr:paraquat-inducible protein A [Salinisphaeraceae bacterium]